MAHIAILIQSCVVTLCKGKKKHVNTVLIRCTRYYATVVPREYLNANLLGSEFRVCSDLALEA